MHDERLAKIIALWRSTQHDGERQAARAKGERLTKQLGMSFEDAVVADDVHNHPRNGDIFAGFDDFMEAKEPGYKAAAAREKAEKIAARGQAQGNHRALRLGGGGAGAVRAGADATEGHRALA
jgi:hypothetical protein